MIPFMKVELKKNRNAIGDILGNLVGEEGLKADVAIKLAPATIPILIASIVAAIIIGGVASHFIIKKIG
jgi:hypothetical protein